MKSFTQFISENLNPTQEDYNEIIRLLISDDPLERYLGAQELELYSDEEKMRVQQGILDFFKLDSEKIKKISQSATNPYYTLIEFEKIGAVDFFNTPENIFRDLFKNQFIIKAAAENMSFEEIVNKTLEIETETTMQCRALAKHALDEGDYNIYYMPDNSIRTTGILKQGWTVTMPSMTSV
jgi:hypothetical protein